MPLKLVGHPNHYGPAQSLFPLNPSIYFPPPPKSTSIEADQNVTIISAAEKRLSDTTFLTSARRMLHDNEADQALLVRHHKNLTIGENDIYAICQLISYESRPMSIRW